MAEPLRAIIAMGHRNTDRGGASNEINWTPGCARAVKAAIEEAGGKAWIVQENDTDNDPNWYPSGLQQMARRAVELAPKYGPFDVYISCHYNGGAGPGFHAIFPDAWSGTDQKADNPLDVTLCRNLAAAVKATNTVGLMSWTADRPGVMSERESGVGAQGHRLGEFYGSIGFRDRTARVIIEAGSIDVAWERAYINDANWVRNVYARAIVAGLKATFPDRTWGTQPQPQPEPQPVAIGVGDLVKTTVELNVRDAAALGGQVFTTLPVGAQLRVIGGPATADGLTWWNLEGNVTGWAAVGSGDTAYLEVVEKAQPPKPTPHEKPLAIPDLDRYKSGDVPAMPHMLPVTIEGEDYIAVPVSNRVKTKVETPRWYSPKEVDARLVGGPIEVGHEFELAFLAFRKADPTHLLMGRTPAGTWVEVDALEYLAD